MTANNGSVVIAVEDGPACATLRQLLERASVTVREARSVDEVVQLAAEQPQLLIVDAALTRLDSQEACHRLAADPATAGLPVLFLAADGDAADLERLVREAATLDRMSPQMPVTAQAFGMKSVREHSPAAFADLVDEYGGLMDRALEESHYIVDHHITDELRTLAETLGSLGAGPRDIIELHNTALRKKREDQRARKAQQYVEEGRFLVLELMGHLASFYRRHAMGIRPRASQRTAPRKDDPDA